MESRDLSAHTPYRAGRGTEEVARDIGMDPDELVKLSSTRTRSVPAPT